MNAIYDLKDMLCEELEQMVNNGNINLDTIDKLTHTLKSVETIIAMKEGGYSTSVMPNNSRYYEDSNSYRNGRNGGISYNENYNSYRMNRRNSGYSRADGKEEMIANLREMMEESTGEQKNALRHCMEQLQNM